MFDTEDQALVLHLAGCTLAKKAGKNNWLEEDAVGGLPDYICRIARAVHRNGSHSISQSIAIAVGRVKTWASGGGGVNAGTRAKAAKALAEWESKKKAAKLNNKTKLSHQDDMILNLSSWNVDDIRRQYKENYPSSDTNGPYRWVREMWSDYLIVNIESGLDENQQYVKVPYTVDKQGIATFGQEIPVKQAYVELSNLESPLTDAQLELAALIPCTDKVNRSLLDTVRLSQQLKMEEEELMQFSSFVLNLMAVRY